MPIKLSVDEALILRHVQYVGYDHCDDDVKELFDYVVKRKLDEAMPHLVELRKQRRSQR